MLRLGKEEIGHMGECRSNLQGKQRKNDFKSSEINIGWEKKISKFNTGDNTVVFHHPPLPPPLI